MDSVLHRIKEVLRGSSYEQSGLLAALTSALGKERAEDAMAILLHPTGIRVWQQLDACVDDVLKKHPVTSDAPPHWPIESEMAVGRAVAPLFSLTNDDVVASCAMQSYMLLLHNRDGSAEEENSRRRSLCDHYVALGRWASYNFPSVRLTPVQACALALSDMTEEQIEEAHPPWPSFRLLFGDAFVTDADQVTDAILSLKSLPSGEGAKWHLAVRLSSGATLWNFSAPSKLLFNGGVPDVEGLLVPNKAEKRVMQMVGRLCLNLCEVLGGSFGALRPAKERKVKGGKRRPVTGQGRSYELALPVKVDMRAHMRDYTSTDEKRIYKVRWVVRGHWRQQVCGTGRAERRRRWIEPYWKGPEKGTRIVREHQVADAVVGLPEEVEECPTTVETTQEGGAETPPVEQL